MLAIVGTFLWASSLLETLMESGIHPFTNSFMQSSPTHLTVIYASASYIWYLLDY